MLTTWSWIYNYHKYCAWFCPIQFAFNLGITIYISHTEDKIIFKNSARARKMAQMLKAFVLQ